jgi:sortase A
MPYLYVKKSVAATGIKLLHLSHRTKSLFAVLFFIGGIGMFSSAVLPILIFQLEYSVRFTPIVSPLSSKFYNQPGKILGELTTDYTQLSNWFVDDPDSKNHVSTLISNKTTDQYFISIPKLKIDSAVVTIGSMDLKKSLIQYPQTALPGQPGNTVVFGHSVLPQFFNPKSYLTIFSTLYRLKEGDEIDIEYGDHKYVYYIEDMFEIQPTNFSVLEQHYDSRYLSLITCSPPGTYLRRLVIKAKLSNI